MKKMRKRPEYCEHPFGVRCIHAKKDLGWTFGCKTCTKWNRKLQVSNFKAEEKTKKALRRDKILRIITLGILLILAVIGGYFSRHAQGIW